MAIPMPRGFNATAKASTGAPSTGTWAVGDVMCDSVGEYFRCTVAGTPGTWAGMGGSVTLATDREVNASEPPASSDSRLRGLFGIEYISDGDAEINGGTWATYKDAAATLPADGQGGTSTLAWTRDTAAPMRGVASWKFAKPASNVQGEGVGRDFTIPDCDCNKTLTLTLKLSQASANPFPVGALSLHVYDTGNLRLVPIGSGNVIQYVTNINVGSATATVQFTTTNSNSYRLCLHCPLTETTSWDVLLDDISITPVYLPSSPAMSDWQDGGAITITATTTNPTKGTMTTDKVRWRRIGDSAEITYEFNQSGAGSAGSGTYLLGLPSGLSIDTAKLGQTTTETDAPVVGVCTYNAGAGIYTGVAKWRSTGIICSATPGGSNSEFTWGSGGGALSNAGIRMMVQVTVPISGWSGSTAVQPGNRYLWAQRFAANAVRVTAAPTKPGEYRARRVGTDTAPTTGPSVADGFRIDAGSGIAAGRINLFDIYIGPGKIVQLSPYLSTGRTGKLCTDFYYNTAYRGLVFTYDSVTGTATIYASPNGASDAVGVDELLSVGQATGYFDILVADDPVPVALAPAVHVEASSDAGQVVTGGTEDVEYEDKQVDTHGAWSGSVFTAPVAGVYLCAFNFAPNSVMNATPQLWKNGASYRAGPVNVAVAGNSAGFSTSVRLAAGDTVRFRSGNSYTANGYAVSNWMSITRIGDA